MSNNQQTMMLNRLKAALAEQDELTAGYQNNLVNQKTPSPDGVPIKCSHPYNN